MQFMNWPSRRSVLSASGMLLIAALACNFASQPDAAATLNIAVTQTVGAGLAAASPAASQPRAAADTPQPPISVTLQWSTDTPLPPTAAPATSHPTQADLVRPNGSPFHAIRLLSAPSIDGDVSDWGALLNAADKIVYRPANWSGPADNSASFAVGWDPAQLYVAVQVVDDHLVQTQRDGQLFKGDSVELLLDSDLAGDYTDLKLSADDYQIGFSPGDLAAGDPPPQAYLWFPKSREGLPAGVAVAAKPTADGYTIEAAIPWSSFEAAPTAGSRFGFVLSVSDNDAAGTADQQSMVSAVSTRRLTDPTTWGTLILDQ